MTESVCKCTLHEPQPHPAERKRKAGSRAIFVSACTPLVSSKKSVIAAAGASRQETMACKRDARKEKKTMLPQITPNAPILSRRLWEKTADKERLESSARGRCDILGRGSERCKRKNEMMAKAVWARYKKSPARAECINPTPATPMRNEGPTSPQEKRSRSASFWEMAPVLERCAAVSAPMGAPQSKARIRGNQTNTNLFCISLMQSVHFILLKIKLYLKPLAP